MIVQAIKSHGVECIKTQSRPIEPGVTYGGYGMYCIPKYTYGACQSGNIGIGQSISEAINNCMNLFKEIGIQGYAGPITGESKYVNTK